jgi:hypothetical protein
VPDLIPMNPDEVRTLFLQRLGLRIGPETAAYVLRRLEAGHAALPLGGSAGESAGGIPVMAGDARTGVAVRRTVDASQITRASA